MKVDAEKSGESITNDRWNDRSRQFQRSRIAKLSLIERNAQLRTYEEKINTKFLSFGFLLFPFLLPLWVHLLS